VTARATWRGLLQVAGAAALAFWLVDRAAAWIAPPVVRREVADGVADLRRADPHVLVLGSSHARSFEALGDSLAARSAGARTLVAVPVEFGKFTAYDWVLQHRLRPLLEERAPDGTRRRGALRRFILVTEWWDGCGNFGGAPLASLPSRAWTAGDFLADVRAHGLTPYNRNWLQSVWRRLWSGSALVQDRGKSQVLLQARRRFLDGPEAEAAREARFLDEWRTMIEGGEQCLGDPDQAAALRRILDWAAGERLHTTIVLFPRKPATITPAARATTLARYAAQMREAAAPTGADVVDLTTGSPVTDADFMADFDHVSAEGNRKFAGWLLQHALADLVEPAQRAVRAP
jgi:hypothetical protein